MLKGLQERLPGGGIVAELPLQQPDNLGGIRGQRSLFQIGQQLFVGRQRFLLFPRIEQRLCVNASGKHMVRRAFYNLLGNREGLFGGFIVLVVLDTEIQPGLNVVIVGNREKPGRHGYQQRTQRSQDGRGPAACFDVIDHPATCQGTECEQGR
ncbi:MAG: hypothetical protein BWY09_02782 [Candidatus Hydrogenedentes bacterium ADurb.Bin179]|nr:MAG: hypothetical protein BWY09_02782 [Candidatus Hydrogenedentes bacterium ADurb.Bin179]